MCNVFFKTKIPGNLKTVNGEQSVTGDDPCHKSQDS